MSKVFGESESDQEIIKALNLTEDEVLSQNVPIKQLVGSKEDILFAVAVAEKIGDYVDQKNEAIRKKEKEIPVWEQTTKPLQQVRKFY